MTLDKLRATTRYHIIPFLFFAAGVSAFHDGTVDRAARHVTAPGLGHASTLDIGGGLSHRSGGGGFTFNGRQLKGLGG